MIEFVIASEGTERGNLSLGLLRSLLRPRNDKVL